MSVTATELKNNLGKYLVLAATEDIFITKNGKVVAKLTNPYEDRVRTAKSLFGILPVDADEDAVVERAAVKAGMDYIITRNVKDYQQGMVKAIFPDDLIVLMEEKQQPE